MYFFVIHNLLIYKTLQKALQKKARNILSNKEFVLHLPRKYFFSARRKIICANKFMSNFLKTNQCYVNAKMSDIIYITY
ncbi:hypothetical protein FACS189429_1660 [Bacteroidia bacterium]|nr:hypothetical protein FACS189429_1660 [Bacteroidia bacterium]